MNENVFIPVGFQPLQVRNPNGFPRHSGVISLESCFQKPFPPLSPPSRRIVNKVALAVWWSPSVESEEMSSAAGMFSNIQTPLSLAFLSCSYICVHARYECGLARALASYRSKDHFVLHAFNIISQPICPTTSKVDRVKRLTLTHEGGV